MSDMQTYMQTAGSDADTRYMACMATCSAGHYRGLYADKNGETEYLPHPSPKQKIGNGAKKHQNVHCM